MPVTLNKNLSLEKLLTGIAEASLELLKSADLRATLNKVVAIMGKSADADRCYIFENRNNTLGVELCLIIEWNNEGIMPQIDNPDLQAVPYEVFPGLFERFRSGEAVYGLVSEAAEPFRSIMQEQDILSFVFLPIFQGTSLWGFVGYDACSEPRIWQQAEVKALQTLASGIGVFLQNNQLKRAFEIRNQQYSLAIKGSKDGIWEIDFATGKMYFSELWREQFGYSHVTDPSAYEHWLELIHPDERTQVHRSLERYLNRGQGTNDLEFRLKHGSGHYVWVLSRSAAEWDHLRNPIRMAGSDRDITERKIHEQILEENEKQYRNLVNNLKEVVFESDGDGRITFLNASWEQLTGYSVPESLGRRGAEFLDPDLLPGLPVILKDLDEKRGQYVTYELRYIHKKGHLVWAEVTAKRVCDTQGNIIGTAGTIIDLSEKRKTETRLLQSEAKYRLISENITDIITQHELNGEISFVSPSVTELLGYTPEAMIGRSPQFIIHPDDWKRLTNSARDLILVGKSRLNINYRVRHQNGGYLWVESLTKNIYNKSGDRIAIQVSTRDITERKKAEEAMARALEKKQELTELKARFVMMASHEFRTPLATIKSSVDIIRMYLNESDKKTREKCHKHFGKVNSEINRVGDLMNDILLLGKLEAGKREIQLRELCLEELAKSIISLHFSAEADQRKPELQVLGQARPVMLDEQLIAHILQNLLHNALKFSAGAPAPQLMLDYRRKKLLISVQDKGKGLSPTDKKRIFEPFYRGKNAVGIAGTGLGLVVVKEFVELHNGKIHFRSGLQKGTTFTIELKI